MTTATAIQLPISFEEFCNECVTRDVDSLRSYVNYGQYLYEVFGNSESVELFNAGFNQWQRGNHSSGGSIATPIEGLDGFLSRNLLDCDHLRELLDEEQLAKVEAYEETLTAWDGSDDTWDWMTEYLGEDTIREDILGQLLWSAKDWLEANNLDCEELMTSATYEEVERTCDYSTYAIRFNRD